MRNFVLSCVALLATASGAASADKIRVLILTGESDYSHPWQPNVPFMRSMLMNSGRFEVRVEEEVRGITAATLGIMVPLMVADITRGTGRFNLAQGIVGSGIGIGASLSTTLAGWMSDRLGSSVAFLGLACIGGAGLMLAWRLMPETMEKRKGPKLLASGRS